MSVRKALKAKRDAAAKPASEQVIDARPALPAGDTREIPVEPLPPAVDSGRDAARDAFVRDAGPDAAPLPEDAPTPPAHESRDGAPPPAAQTMNLSAEQATALGIEILDRLVTGFAPTYVGGSKKTWALDGNDRTLLQKAGEPVVAKHLSTSISIEWALVLVVASVYIGKADAALSEVERENAERERLRQQAPPTPTVAPQPAPLAVVPPKKTHGW